MKEKTKQTVVFILFCIALFGTSFLYAQCRVDTEPEHFWAAHRTELQKAAEKVLSGTPEDKIRLEGIRRVQLWQGENRIVEFYTDDFGVVRENTYQGIYYSENGEPAAFQNTEIALEKTDAGWYWQERGNSGSTKRLDEHWFLFEATF